MRKSAVVVAGLLLLSMFSMLGASADVDGVFDIWEKDGNYQYAWWYNHDNTVLKGPEYKAQIAQLLADGYTYRGYAVTESTGGAGPQFGSYDEDYFVKTTLEVMMEGGIGILFRTTPEGLQYNDPELGWIAVPPTMEVPVEVEELQLLGVFDHDAWGVYRENRRWYLGWHDTGEDKNAPMITIVNEDGTEATWAIMDLYGTSVAMMVVTGEEEWDTRIVVYELPPTPAGAPTLMPKNYGQILNQPYNKYGLAEGQAIPTVFEQYVKYDGDKVMTYANSPLDIWFYRYIYKPNHEQSQQERIEATAWYQKAHGAFVTVN
jgi:hypothetical protein